MFIEFPGSVSHPPGGKSGCKKVESSRFPEPMFMFITLITQKKYHATLSVRRTNRHGPLLMPAINDYQGDPILV